MPYEGQLKRWSHKCEDFLVQNISLKIISILRGILWHFIINFVEEIYNEILMKMFKSAGGLLVTDEIKFKIMTSRHQAYHLFKNHLYRMLQRKEEATKTRHVEQLEEQERQQSKHTKKNVIRTLTEKYSQQKCNWTITVHTLPD